ncbi:MAG: signal peptidase I [Tenericutes bacterium]|nr:signal peptidase I [Mycoplasmatota bacterium]
MDWLDIKEFLSDTIKYIIFIVVILVIAVYVVGLQQIVGPSMTPTLRNGDIVILDKLSYRFSEIKRDDIVALYYADTKFLVKRVVGLPGETVEFKDNKLYINGKYYEEKYLGDDIVTDNFSLEELNYTTIPDDMYLVLGDNRGDSMDSRDSDVGLIPKKDIYGKVRFKIWPINEFKYVK